MSTRITFLGAAGEVTGSSYLVETPRARVLVDLGMFQGHNGAEGKNTLHPAVRPQELDAVLVTHGHLDHVGRLPLLGQAGYRGDILLTQATGEMAALILQDSARIQKSDTDRRNRKLLRAGKAPEEPLYTEEEARATIRQFHAVPYRRPVPVAQGLRAVWVEAGHMLGSASIELLVEGRPGAREQRLVFSGDLGPTGAPILKDPEGFPGADTVVLESTYGDRDHKPLADTVREFEDIVREAVERKSKLLAPSFAVGRVQLLLYLLALAFREGRLPKFPVFVDSPMAGEASEIYRRHLELFDEDFHHLNLSRPVEADLNTVHYTASVDESKALNGMPGPCLILAGSGMCTGGRILHHLKENLWRENCGVLFVGYQAQGSLGRVLVEGARKVHIFGDEVAVKARMHTLGGFSAHAGQSDLLRWFGHLAGDRPRVILTHGEARGREPLAKQIRNRWGLAALCPEFGETVELAG